MLADINRAIADDHFTPTDWEAEFLENIGGLIGFELELSEKQDETLEAIWKRATR